MICIVELIYKLVELVFKFANFKFVLKKFDKPLEISYVALFLFSDEIAVASDAIVTADSSVTSF